MPAINSLVPYALLVGPVIGILALGLMMPSSRLNLQNPIAVKLIGGLLGGLALGLLWLGFAPKCVSLLGMEDQPAFLFSYIFGALAIGSAVRVITHTKPVYAALWFIMVVLSCGGIYLTLSAEFMAMALVIIYGGAILVTYMFVIMLARPLHEQNTENCDTHCRAPWLATTSGMLLLSVLLSLNWSTLGTSHYVSKNPNASFDQMLLDNIGEDAETLLDDRPEIALAEQKGQPIPEATQTHKIGLDLFANHPLAIELAGILLLVSLLGAIVMARTTVHEEEETGTDDTLPGVANASDPSAFS